jgi:hypothetical protein
MKNIKHYAINNLIFIDYMEAYNYCIKNKLDTNQIIKTYKY